MVGDPAPVQRRPLRVVDVLGVFAMSALAVAQPFYDLLGRNASFFVAHRASRLDVLLITLAFLVVPPAVLVGIRCLIGLCSRRAGHSFQLITMGALGALALTPPIFKALSLRWPVALLLVGAVATGIALVFRRYAAASRIAAALAVGVVAFPALFVFASDAKGLLFPQRLPERATEAPARSDVPVTVVLFDELALSSIITPEGGIDAERYPNLARFARRSTWYRDATVSGLRTDQSVPAVLTGRRVPRRQVPSSFAYPQNMFTLLSRTHRLHVHEHVTQLCPPDLCTQGADSVSGSRALFTDAAVVYGHIVLPSDLAAHWLPPLGDRWAGFTRAAGEQPIETGTSDPVSSWLRSRLIATREQHEGDVFDRFLGGLDRDGAKPQLSWMHSQVPHPPWRYLHTGQTYVTGGGTPGYRNFRWSKNQYLTDEVLQRSLLQTKYADTLVGDLIDRLERAELWDDSLVILLADHGATWEAGKSRREVDGPQGSSLLGVPLFVKYPGQRDGVIDRTNVELVDVLPTIADVTGVDVPWETHGSSLRSDERRDAKRVFDGRRERTVRYSFSDLRRRAGEIEELFGHDIGPDDLYGFGPDRELIGRDVSTVELDAVAPVRVAVADGGGYDEVDPDGRVLPAMFRARLEGGDVRGGRRVAVALNGRVAGVGQTFTEEGGVQVAVMLSPRYLHDGPNDVELYWIVDR